MPDIELSIKKARSILKEAKKEYEGYSVVYEGDIPDDEEKMVEEAVEVVEMAEQARENELDHPAIEKILFLAEVDGDSPSNPEAIEEPWEGYDKEKIGKIIQKLPKLDEAELAQVFDYEREKKNRDTIIETLEEMGAEAGGTEESDEDYKPWGKYDEEKPAKIIAQIEGMQTDDPEFFEKILAYEEENQDRKSIKAVLEETIEEKKAKAEDSGEESGDSQEEGEEDGLTRQDIEDMDLAGLKETLEYNELDPDEIIGDAPDLAAARVKTADAFELEWPEDDDPEASASEDDGEGEEGYGADYVWADLEEMDADDLKLIIKEKDLGMRITAKSDLNDVRERIADKLEIAKPAPVPWRGYDKREVEQIVKKLAKLDNDELAEVFAYESENKDRKTIMKKLEEIAEERGLTTVGDSSSEEDSGGSEEEDSGAEEKETPEEEEETEPEAEASEDEPDHEDLIKHVTQRVEKEHFAIPAPLPENITTLPFDLTELSDKEVRQQYSAFLSYFGRASYVAKIEKQLGIACKNIADDAYDDALAALDKIDPETEKEKSATQLKAEAERAPKVRKWRKRERQHNSLKESMRADAEIYKQNLDSLSREWTMRTEEIDHSGGLGPRGKAGKKATAKKARK